MNGFCNTNNLFLNNYFEHVHTKLQKRTVHILQKGDSRLIYYEPEICAIPH